MSLYFTRGVLLAVVLAVPALTCFGAPDPATNVSGLQIWHPTDQGSHETSQSGIELAGAKLRSG
jgi:hypothetical protein